MNTKVNLLGKLKMFQMEKGQPFFNKLSRIEFRINRVRTSILLSSDHIKEVVTV